MKRIAAFFLAMLLFLVVCTGCSNNSSRSKEEIPKPEFSPPGGKMVHDKNIHVEISAVQGAKIYYTLDGSEPTTSSHEYKKEIIINHTESRLHDPRPGETPNAVLTDGLLIRAIAVKQDGETIIKSQEARTNYRVDKIYHKFEISYLDEPDNPDENGSHRLDIYYPKKLKTGKDAEVIFFVPGGGFQQVDKNLYFELGNTLSGCYGYITVVINYHVSDNIVPPKNSIYFPHLIEDVAAAFNFVRRELQNQISDNTGKTSVDYKADVSSINVFGQSAGATLVSLLALHPGSFSGDEMMVDTGNIKSVISMSGIYDFYALTKYPDNPLGLTKIEISQYKMLTTNTLNSEEKEILDLYSPVTYVSKAVMPFYILYSVEDGVGFSTQARFFYNKFMESGVQQDIAIDYYKMNYYKPDIQEAGDVMAKENAVVYNILPAGHYAEVAAINTRDWNNEPVKMLISFLKKY